MTGPGEGYPRPSLRQLAQDKTGAMIAASHHELGERYLYAEAPQRYCSRRTKPTISGCSTLPILPCVKDGINNFIVHGKSDAVNSGKQGTKASAHYQLTLKPGASDTVRLRLCEQPAKGSPKALGEFFGNAFKSVFKTRLQEADEFYAAVIPQSVKPDAANVMRQALAGMLWSKQFFSTTSQVAQRTRYSAV